MKKIALIIIDHGSTVDQANNLLITLAEKIRSNNNCTFDIVEHCHMELAEPTLGNAFKKCVDAGASDIVVHPYFLVPGRHSKTDIPNMVESEAKKYNNITYRITEPLGIHDKIIDVILERSNPQTN